MEDALRTLAVPHLLGEGLVAGGDLPHLGCDRRKVLGRKRLVVEEIVVEAVLDHRADGMTCVAGHSVWHRLREPVRAIMADQLERARVRVGDDLDCPIMLDRVGKIGETRYCRRDPPRARAARNPESWCDIP